MGNKYERKPSAFRHYNGRRPEPAVDAPDREERGPAPKVTLPKLKFMEREPPPPSPRELPPRRGRS
jgi:hypothetical protein